MIRKCVERLRTEAEMNPDRHLDRVQDVPSCLRKVGFCAVAADVGCNVVDCALAQIKDRHAVFPVTVVAVARLAATLVAKLVDAGDTKHCVPRHPMKSTFAYAIIALCAGAVLCFYF